MKTMKTFDGHTTTDDCSQNAADTMLPDGNSLAKSFSHAGQGVAFAIKTQRNMRIHLAFALAAITLGFICGITLDQWLIVILCIGVVFGLECANTAIENVVDLVSPQYHELAKHAKDAAAAAVLCAAVSSFIIGTILFVPGLLALFGIVI